MIKGNGHTKFESYKRVCLTGYRKSKNPSKKKFLKFLRRDFEERRTRIFGSREVF